MSDLWDYLTDPQFSTIDLVIGYFVGRAIWEAAARLWKRKGSRLGHERADPTA